jgi:predicted anti-sigma-YlaC factor YlaD
MQCPSFREAASARLDGEPPGVPVAELDRHLASCAGCARWVDRAAAVTRRARLAPAAPVPDLTVRVLAALPTSLPGARAAARARLLDTALRLLLAALAVAQAGLAWPALTSGTAAMSAPVHMAHESGAWNAAVAVAFAAVAAAPRWAPGSLPFLGAFTALLLTATVRDVVAGHVHVDRAVAHLLLLAGVLVLAALAWRRSRMRRPGPGRAAGVPRAAA